jgi:hypothetical protein
MPWRPGPGHGFTSAPRPWLPDPGRTDADTVATQRSDPGSYLRRFRDLLHLRRSLRLAASAPVRWLSPGSPVIGYRRPEVLVAMNGGPADATVQVPSTAIVAFSSAGTAGAARIAGDAGGHAVLTLTPDETVIVRTNDSGFPPGG